jgi:hypothetical protein
MEPSRPARSGPGDTCLKSPTMTDDITRQNELKKMTLCDSCAGIQRNWRKAPGHPELVQGGNRQERRGGALVTVTSYQCDRCGTAWEYENDKANLKAGWSVVGRARS